eukprot:12809218-Ditylum_brightwellii.AAC.1
MLTIKECEKLQAHLYPHLLSQLGYHSSFPRAVALASTDYCGTGVQHLKALQIAMQLDYIVKHIRADTDSGKSAECMLQWAQQ